MQTSLAALSADTLLDIVRACGLEDAAHLSVTAKAMHVLIKPLLPSLCDAGDLQLIIWDSRECPLDVELPRQNTVWWGLSYQDESIVISISGRKVTYHRVHSYPEDQQLCLSYPEYWHSAGQTKYVPYLSLDMDNTNGVIHSISKKIVRHASLLFTSVKAKHAAKNFLQQHPQEEASTQEVAANIYYLTILSRLDFPCPWCGSWAPLHVAQKRLMDLQLQFPVLRQRRVVQWGWYL